MNVGKKNILFTDLSALASRCYIDGNTTRKKRNYKSRQPSIIKKISIVLD